MRGVILLLTGMLFVAAVQAEEPVPPRDPAKELQTLQGRWKLHNSILVADRHLKTHLPDAGVRLATVRIDGNQMHLAGSPTQTLIFAHNLSDEAGTAATGIDGHRRIFFTFSDGRGLMGSFQVKDDKLEIRIPPHCCSRSGVVLSFQRVKE